MIRPTGPLLIGLLCSVAGALLVRGVTLLLPDVPEGAALGMVLGVSVALGCGVYARTRRGRPRPPR
ncbi:hypothetical protein ACF068_14060 [Streptomyces sp. NPDC016309]|uniref:hypothetical protein n=1 Tax=Streptomyces sp. NPDC016309 TaxID=3364965 RepID=UPI0036FDD3E7